MTNKVLLSFEDTSLAFAAKTDKELKKTHFLFSLMNKKEFTKIGTKILKTALHFRFPVRSIVRNTLFKHFCGGETVHECLPVIKRLHDYHISTILDLAGEGTHSEETYKTNASILHKLIEFNAVAKQVSFVVLKMTAIASPFILEKIQKGKSLSTGENEIFETIKSRFDKICEEAYDKGTSILVDAEESWIQGTVDILVYAMMAKYNRDRPVIYNTYQMYRSDMMYNLEHAIELASKDKFYLGVKLVRGAYLEKETRRASTLNYLSPIFSSKEETDKAYNDALEFCIHHLDNLWLVSGSHNEKSNMQLAALMDKKNLERGDKRIMFAQLYGMGDHISYNLAQAGYNAGKYLPVGPVEAAIPYLIRRAEENQSIASQTGRELTLINKEVKRRESLKANKVK